MTQACITLKNLDELCPDQVISAVETNSYAVIRGLYSKEEIEISLQQIKANMPLQTDHPAFGENSFAVQQNFQKIIVGGGSQRSYYVPRCVRVAYNPVWAKDLFKMRNHFKLLAKVRNVIMNTPKNYAVDQIEEDGFWTASRLQHYPSGGGFFYRHRDVVLEEITRKAGLTKFLQIILLLTQKGKDFENGGAFIEHNGVKINLENDYGSGDILIYDKRTVHGVDDIDPNKKLDFQCIEGRVVGMASLYTTNN